MDRKFIFKCFELAKKGSGRVSPNPLVGCVVVKNGKIIGEGWHSDYGKAHAEKNAIRNCKEPVNGSTLYCNLEPCSHTNKNTPPCVPDIINNGISRVVVSNIDTNPDVNGKGLAQLSEAGIETTAGVEEKAGQELNRFYFKYVKTKTPFVSVKIAQTIDGRISECGGKQSLITGAAAGEFVHRQRGLFDAVLVGANSVIVDNPELTVRHVNGRDPVRIILDGKLRLPDSAKVICNNEHKKTWIITSDNADANKRDNFIEKGVKLIQLPADKLNRINLEDVLKKLGDLKITSLMVEGGSEIFSKFIEQELFDELIILQSPKFFGKGINSLSIDKKMKLKLKSFEKLGDDLKIIYEKF